MATVIQNTSGTTQSRPGTIHIVGPVPGPRSRELMERRKRAVAPGLASLHPIFVASASGAAVTDVDGNVFLDFTGGIGVLNVGHTQPVVVGAIQEQAGLLTHACFQVAGYEGYVALAEKLCALTPGAFEKRAMLVSTGAEAVENAVKIARAHTGREGVLCFDHAFHGRTLLGMTLTGKATPYKVGGAYAPAVYRLPYPYAYRDQDPRPLSRTLATVVRPSELAAVIIEPVLGEGGFVVPPVDFLKELRSFCDQHGIILIADEIQTGFGRTGTMFASESLELVPDLMTLAKSIAGGLPLAAVVGRASVIDSVGPGGLGGTFGGNPIACAAALRAIALLEDLVSSGRARAVGNRIATRLQRLRESSPLIGQVRGLGPMQAIELVRDQATKEPADTEAKSLIAKARERGLLLLAAGTYGNVIRFLTPLTISDSELNEGFYVLEVALQTLRE